MNGKNKFIIVVILLTIVGVWGTKKVIELRNEAQREKQVTFLKKNTDKMTEYVKNKNPKSKISYIKYDWMSFEVSSSGAFTKKLYSMNINLYNSNDEKINGGKIIIIPDDIENPTKINELATNNFDKDIEETTND